MFLEENNLTEAKLKYLLWNSLKVIRMYDWMIDSYVLDFYVDRHWNKLPNSWQRVLSHVNPMQLNDLLESQEHKVVNCVWPLSLLALKNLLRHLCLSRDVDHSLLVCDNVEMNDNMNNNRHQSNVEVPLFSYPKLRNLFMKRVKPKKQHEIEKMAKICYHITRKLKVQYIVDFGSGLGHLARILSYGYGLNVCCLEMQSELNQQAEIIDKQFEVTISKSLNTELIKTIKRPVHITIKLTELTTLDEFLFLIKSAFKVSKNNDDFKFGIIGVHPCGDLSSILINLFLQCNEAKFLNLIGCCYMKLTTTIDNGNSSMNTKNYNKNDEIINNNGNLCSQNMNYFKNKNSKFGYPLSKFLTEINVNVSKNFSKLSYESREIACHAIEIYKLRLHKGNYEDLKIHSYRAALEEIINDYCPQFKHYGLRSVKHTNSLTFENYCQKALKGLDVHIPPESILSHKIQNNLKQWRNVVIFYTLRLIFAPLIESVILYDRILYLIEKGCNVNVNAIFDPLTSPRNHITIASKNS